MGLFGFLKRSKPAPAKLPVMREVSIVVEPERVSPDKLRKQLFDAATTGDNEKLSCLCQLHEKSIFEQGIIWSKVPPEIRGNPALLRWYGNGLKAIARYCAESLGKPELMEHVKQIEALPEPGGERAAGEKLGSGEGGGERRSE